MKKFFTVILIFSAFQAFAQFLGPALPLLDLSETASEMYDQVQFLSSAALEGRGAGSQGESDAADYVTKQLEAYGVEMLLSRNDSMFGIRCESGDTLRSRNVIGCIQGYDRELRDHYIVIAARLDNLGTSVVNVDGVPREKVFYGANGNASGLAVMMQLAKMLSTNSVLLRRSVIFAAFGSSLQGGAGAWYFLNRSFPEASRIDAMVNLDMLGTGSGGFYAYTASNDDLNRLLGELDGTLQPVHPRLVAMEPVDSDHRIFYDRGIPAVLFTTGMYPEYNTDRDTASILEYADMERELEYIYNFSLALANGPKPAFRPSDETRRSHVDDDSVVPYYECDQKPVFLGSNDPMVFLRKWVYVYMKYPQEAVSRGIQGRVLVDFIIDRKGKVGNVKVVKGVDPLLDAEAVRVVKASPDWKPGRVRGEKVNSEMSLYIDFRLERKK